MKLLLAALISSSLGVAPATAQRPYWRVALDSLALGRTTHTHVQVTGRVDLVKLEADGDLHIRLRSLTGSGRFIVAECIPKLPCRHPLVGQTVTVQGISRWDPEHMWAEVHPVEVGP